MTGRLQETLEETQRRLALGGVTTAPMMQTRDTPPRPPRNTVGAIIAIVVFVIVAAVIALAAVGSIVGDEDAVDQGSADQGAVDQGSADEGSADWPAYPGNAYLDADAVLAAPSLEQVVDRSRELTERIKADLTTRFGLEWQQLSDERQFDYPNGYGGDSMLATYRAPQWQGTVVLDDPGARAAVLASIETIARDYGLDEFSLQNSLSPDDAWARQQYGASLSADQPLFTVFAPSNDTSGFSLQYSVLDENLTADPTFVGGSWFDTAPGSGVLHVSIEAFGDNLLADTARAGFERALAPYAGLDKPDPLDLG